MDLSNHLKNVLSFYLHLKIYQKPEAIPIPEMTADTSTYALSKPKENFHIGKIDEIEGVIDNYGDNEKP